MFFCDSGMLSSKYCPTEDFFGCCHEDFLCDSGLLHSKSRPLLKIFLWLWFATLPLLPLCVMSRSYCPRLLPLSSEQWQDSGHHLIAFKYLGPNWAFEDKNKSIFYSLQIWRFHSAPGLCLSAVNSVRTRVIVLSLSFSIWDHFEKRMKKYIHFFTPFFDFSTLAPGFCPSAVYSDRTRVIVESLSFTIWEHINWAFETEYIRVFVIIRTLTCSTTQFTTQFTIKYTTMRFNLEKWQTKRSWNIPHKIMW